MECSTVYCDVDECAVVLSIKTHTAKKKENTCRECRRTIGLGERYLIESIVFEGSSLTMLLAWTVKVFEMSSLLMVGIGVRFYGCSTIISMILKEMCQRAAYDN